MQTTAAAKKLRSSAALNVYLIIRQRGQILLSLRQNTGYNDGLYAFVAGHVEEGESAIHAIIRESYEEAGIHIEAQDLKVVHMMHRRTNRNNVDIFYECAKWTGAIQNLEPDKCGELRFYEQNALPENTIPYITKALIGISQGQFYSEEGWSFKTSRPLSQTICTKQ